MSQGRIHVALKWRLIRNGPNDERIFGLIVGLVAAVAVVVCAVLARTGTIHSSWLTLAVTVFGAMWLLGPLMLPGSTPVVDPQWFRTLAQPPRQIARAMVPSEAIGVGTIITAVALISFVVIATPYGPGPTTVAVIAASAQLLFLLWLGKCVAALVSRLLRTTFGIWLAAIQMSALLAISFAGWVPIMALILPKLGEGSTEVFIPSAPGALPHVIEDAMRLLPTGWGLVAVEASASQASFAKVATPIIGLGLGGVILCWVWVTLTARALSEPPARVQSNIDATRTALLPFRTGGAVGAVVFREIATWFRDPHRKLGLGHAWLTPLLMILLVAPTGWSWALPFIGVMAAAMGAMAAVNTYALDGTALWQLITTPGAFRADVLGRQIAWLILIGFPVVVGTSILCLVSRSPLWAPALGMTLAAVSISCAAAPLFSVLMPAIGATDTRDRVAAADGAGNAAGGEMTVLAAVLLGSAAPVVVLHLSGFGAVPGAQLLLGLATGVAAMIVLTRMTRRMLDRKGQRFLAALTAKDVSRMNTRQPA